MPYIVYPIASTYESVVRPVQLAVAKQIFEKTPITDRCKMVLNGETEVYAQEGSWLDDTDRSVDYGGFTRVYVNAIEEFLEERTLTNSMNYTNTPAWFEDPTTGLVARIQYAYTKVTMSLRVECEDRVIADKYQAHMLRHHGKGTKQAFVNVPYDIIVPDQLLALLDEVHKRRENIAGYGTDLPTWFFEFLRKPVSMKSTLDGNHNTLVLNENQLRIGGVYDYNHTPSVEKSDRPGKFEFNFVFTYHYLKPTHISTLYPITVHSQLMPKAWIPMPQPMDDDNYMKIGDAALTNFLAVQSSVGYLNIPRFDDWRIGIRPQHHCMPIVAILTIPSKGNIVLSHESLEGAGYKFHPKIEEYMKTRHKRLNKPNQGFFYVTVYDSYDMRISDDKISVDANLNILTSETLDPRKTYHVVWFFNSAPSQWTEEAQEDDRKDFEEWWPVWDVVDPGKVEVLNPDVGGSSDDDYTPEIEPVYRNTPTRRPDGSISKPDWDNLVDSVTQENTNKYPYNDGGVFRCGIFAIITDKERVK